MGSVESLQCLQLLYYPNSCALHHSTEVRSSLGQHNFQSFLHQVDRDANLCSQLHLHLTIANSLHLLRHLVQSNRGQAHYLVLIG